MAKLNGREEIKCLIYVPLAKKNIDLVCDGDIEKLFLSFVALDEGYSLSNKVIFPNQPGKF